jgi:protein subunit release factor A
MKRIFEINAGEGGDHACLLVIDMSIAYKKFFDKKG